MDLSHWEFSLFRSLDLFLYTKINQFFSATNQMNLVAQLTIEADIKRLPHFSKT